MPNKKYQILPVRDKNNKKIIKKDNIFDLPNRLLFVAKTGQGKGVQIANYILRPEFYSNDIEGEDIYIFSPTRDEKTKIIIKNKKIPKENLFAGLDEESLGAVLDFIQEQYEEREQNGEKQKHSLVIIDDCMPSMKDTKNGAFQDLFIRSRHFQCSVWATVQYYNKCPPVCRTNTNGIILFEVNTKQLEDIENDHNYLDDKRTFRKLYHKAVSDSKHSTFVINYTNPKNKMYLDSNFEEINIED